MNINKNNLSKALNISLEKAAIWHPVIQETLDTYSINTEKRVCMFIAQCAHESGSFSFLQENMDYSAIRMAEVWPSRFRGPDGRPNAIALTLAHHPKELANTIYANRMGNRGPETGDGWNYRGRGLIQITGLDNYKSLGDAWDMNLLGNPDLLLEPKYASLSAGWFWDKKNLNSYADVDDIVNCTKVINGGTVGLDDRQRIWNSVKTYLFR